MSKNEMLNKIKIVLDLEGNSKDELLQIYLDGARDYILDYTKIKEIPTTLESVLIDMVVFQYRQKGVENTSTESKGSLYQSFIVSYPNNIMNRLNPYKRALFR